MEIITGVERGRRWRLEEKLRIAEVERLGASCADVARTRSAGVGCGTGVVRFSAASWHQIRCRCSHRYRSPPISRRRCPAPVWARRTRLKTSALKFELPDGTCVRVSADIGFGDAASGFGGVAPIQVPQVLDMPSRKRTLLAGCRDAREG
jgi:hypothetical protein